MESFLPQAVDCPLTRVISKQLLAVCEISQTHGRTVFGYRVKEPVG